MKRLFFTLGILALTLSSFAGPGDKVATAVLTSFNNTFKNVQGVEWNIGDNYYKVSFQLNEQYVEAFYAVDGELMGVAKNIISTQLPLQLQTSLKEKTEGFWISGLVEVSNNEGTAYYATLENGDLRMVVKSENHNWSTVKKQQKS